jgi:hypothetical protein
LTAAEGDDERVIDGADSLASFVGIVAASASTCRSPYERGRPQVVAPGSAAAPLPLLGAARLRCGSACPRSLRAPRAARRLWLSPRWRRRSPSSAPAVVHSSSSWPLSHRRHWEWRSTRGSPSAGTSGLVTVLRSASPVRLDTAATPVTCQRQCVTLRWDVPG